MALRQLNRFCGIVSKSPSIKYEELHKDLVFKKNFHDRIFCFSSVEIVGNLLFDGSINNVSEDNFNLSALNQYNGNWALTEIQKEQITLSCDRVGVRSIYFFENEEFFCFANTIKSLLSLSFIPFKVSSSAAFRFLFLDQNDLVDDCLFEGIKVLPPSNNLIYDLKTATFKIEQYYDFSIGKEKASDDIESTSQENRKQIVAAVEQGVQSSDSMACLLSGGIDSSVIASCLRLLDKHQEIPFITAITDSEGLDETPFAEEVVRHLGIPKWHHVVAGNLMGGIEEMHFAMELPTSSTGSYLQFELMRFSQHQGYQYLLDGTGADALYAGHNYYKPIYWNSLIRRGKISMLIKEIYSLGKEQFWLKYYVKNMLIYYHVPRMKPRSRYRVGLKNNNLLKYLNPDFVNENDHVFSDQASGNLRDLNAFLRKEFFEGGVRKLLRFTDRFGKYFNVMNLPIFAENPQLVEYALNINAKHKIHFDQLKYVLKYSFKDILPLKILERKDKKGLVAPNNKWIRENKDQLLSYFDESLSDFFQVDEMKNQLEIAIDKMDDVENYKVFKFISFAIWHKVFSEKYNS